MSSNISDQQSFNQEKKRDSNQIDLNLSNLF